MAQANISLTLGGPSKITTQTSETNLLGTQFVYLYKGDIGTITEEPQLISSDEALAAHSRDIVQFINYKADKMGSDVYLGQGYNKDTLSGPTLSIYRREIWQEDGVLKGESLYTPVVLNVSTDEIYDYNIGNHRLYDYLYYLTYDTTSASSSDQGISYHAPLKTNWGAWSITELHPVAGQQNQYTAALTDVWQFNCNIEPGAQQQNMSKTQQETLSQYPTFSYGPKNHLSGEVTCLLGKDFAPANILTKGYEYVYNSTNHTWGWELQDIDPITGGGYEEKLTYTYDSATSNMSIDMLKAWRQVCYSRNPKLLKDAKGQTLLIQIISASNTTNETWYKRPESVTFEWAEIGTTEDIIVTEVVSNA